MMVSIIEITPAGPLVISKRFASLMAGIIRQDAISRKECATSRTLRVMGRGALKRSSGEVLLA